MKKCFDLMTSIKKQFESLCSFSSVTFLRQKNTLLVLNSMNYFFHLSGKKILCWFENPTFSPDSSLDLSGCDECPLQNLKDDNESQKLPEDIWREKMSTIVALGYKAMRFLGHYLPISCKTVAMMETSLRIIFTKSTFFF